MDTQLLPVEQTREQKLEEVVREFMVLIESRELVRNIQADHQDNWMLRMTKLVGTLKRAQELLEQP